MGACKSCTKAPEIVQPDIETRGVKSELIRKITTLVNDFDAYQIIKKTQHSFIHDSIFRQQKITSNKIITTQGTLKPINLNKLKEVNDQLNKFMTVSDQCTIDQTMKFKCGLELGDTFPKLKQHMLLSEPKELNFNNYTLIKSWGQGEQMVNFEHAIELVEKLKEKNITLQLIGLTRGNEDQLSTYEELVRSNPGWQKYQHIYLLQEDPDSNIFDIYYQEQTNEILDGYLASALLFYDQTLIWKRYTYEWELSSDSEEVAVEVIQIIDSGIKQCNSQKELTYENSITKAQYLELKKFILKEKNKQSFTRQIDITISKKTIYSKYNKIVQYEKPIILIGSSPKSYQITEEFCKDLKQKSTLWDLQLLKKKLTQKIQENNLNIEASLEKSIKLNINYEQCLLQIPNWEQGILVPYYKSTQYISQVKQWIHARDRILSEYQELSNPVEQRINQMILQFFNNIPTVEKVLNQQYGKIPYAEKRKPPYEEMSVSKSLGNEEITRKSDKILFLLLIDYENDDTLDMLKKLIQYKKEHSIPLQIAVLGHIRAESWTKLFQAFMEKHQLNTDAENGIIETWFPVEDKIGSISFSAILSKMYGMVLEKRDCMLIDLNNQVRIIDSSRRIINKISQIFTELQQQNNKQEIERIDYKQQYMNFKKALRQTPQLPKLIQKVKEQCKDDDTLISYQLTKAKVWDFEGQTVNQILKFNQPTKTQRILPKTSECEELVKILDNTIQ